MKVRQSCQSAKAHVIYLDLLQELVIGIIKVKLLLMLLHL